MADKEGQGRTRKTITRSARRALSRLKTFLILYPSLENSLTGIAIIIGNPLSCDCHNVDLAMHIRNELSSPVTTWFKYLYKNDITCTDSKSTLALTPLSAMQCIFPSENLQAECPNQCLCSYAPYQSHQDLKGHILVNCSGSQISINETTKLFIPKIPNHEDISNVTLDLTHTKLSSLNRLKNIQGYDRVTGLYVSFNNLTEMMPTTVYTSSTEKAASTLPEKLARFAFDHNQISYFDYEALKSQVPELEAVWIGGNPYDCDCDSSELFKFVTRPGHMAKTSVQDPQSVFLNCKNGPLAISDISDNKEFCIDTKDVIIAIGAKYLVSFSSRSLKTREKYISFFLT